MYEVVCFPQVNKPCIDLLVILLHLLKYLFYNKYLVCSRSVWSTCLLLGSLPGFLRRLV